ncbi:MAG TPA: DUF2934 domain-containing protein [Kiritimatiellia bacterium]|nr:DUF2934 domain-containing protein [Kiritimatiellia bacterium]HMP35547.1 DUF2934 domain-containing protein [Kiritimatiellia bacterium]
MAKSTTAKSVKKETVKPAAPVKEKAAPKAKAPVKPVEAPKPAPAAAKPASATKPVPAAKAAPAKAAAKTISAQERYHMIDEAAYYRAEKSGFQVDPHANWVAAEKEIDELLAKQNIKVG